MKYLQQEEKIDLNYVFGVFCFFFMLFIMVILKYVLFFVFYFLCCFWLLSYLRVFGFLCVMYSWYYSSFVLLFLFFCVITLSPCFAFLCGIYSWYYSLFIFLFLFFYVCYLNVIYYLLICYLFGKIYHLHSEPCRYQTLNIPQPCGYAFR